MPRMLETQRLPIQPRQLLLLRIRRLLPQSQTVLGMVASLSSPDVEFLALPKIFLREGYGQVLVGVPGLFVEGVRVGHFGVLAVRGHPAVD